MILTGFDVQTALTMIQSAGFPIACCIALAWYVARETKLQREETTRLNQEHTNEMMAFKDEIKEALNNNTIALTRLCDKLDSDKKG